MSSRVRETNASTPVQAFRPTGMRAAPRSNMVKRYGSVDGGHSLPAFRELIGSEFRLDGGLSINEKAFGEWSKTHKVYLDNQRAKNDQAMLVWHAINNGGEAKASIDERGDPWYAKVSGN